MLRRLSFATIVVVAGCACVLAAQQPEGRGAGAQAAGGGRGGGRAAVPQPTLVLKEYFQRGATEPNEHPVAPMNLTNPNLEITVYGRDAKNVMISGAGANPINIWTGLTTEPVAVLLRDKGNYLDLAGLARIRWVTRASGFHVVRPVVKLADGTMLVGDHAESHTTAFLESEFTLFDVRWVKLDPERIVTTGVYGAVGDAAAWVDKPDLTRVDAVGFADLMPGSGHGSGGWVNVTHIEVYGKAVPR
jgi:hypothetical protein